MVKNLDSFGSHIISTSSKTTTSEDVINFESAKLKNGDLSGKALLISQVATLEQPEKVLFYGILQRIGDKSGPVHSGKGTMVDLDF
jgi:hypothetical protein